MGWFNVKIYTEQPQNQDIVQRLLESSKALHKVRIRSIYHFNNALILTVALGNEHDNTNDIFNNISEWGRRNGLDVLLLFSKDTVADAERLKISIEMPNADNNTLFFAKEYYKLKYERFNGVLWEDADEARKYECTGLAEIFLRLLPDWKGRSDDKES